MPDPQTAPSGGSTASVPRGALALMLFMFFFSGVAALLYQIVWAKELSLVFGVTVYATSAVVTTFMAGLALGSLYFGRVVDRWERPLVLFALLEIGIGAFAACFPMIIGLVKPLYAAFYGPLSDSQYALNLVRFGLSFLVLFLPTFLMGGTLPVISRAYVRRVKHVGGEVAGLYSVNNLGAFLGCIVAGFLSLEFLGAVNTLRAGAALNFAVAAAALYLAWRLAGGRFHARLHHGEPTEPPARLPRPVKVALWVFGIEGFTSLAYQMAWTRMLIFFVAANIYAITIVIATFLVGLALGAFVVKPLVDRTRNPYRMLGLIELGIAATALLTIALLPWLFRFYDRLWNAALAWGFAGRTGARLVICFVVILVPTAFMGATLPVVSRIYVKSLGGLGRRMGVLGCLDTVGSIFGAFAGGFIMIPLLGIQRTIIVTALINLGLAAWVLAADPVARGRRLLRPSFGAAALGLLLAPLLLAAKPLPLIKFSPRPSLFADADIPYYQEDVESTVSVVEQFDEHLTLFVNHAAVAQTTRVDRPSHEMIAHTPLLLHPEPKRALLIGFGIGFTTWACRVHDVDVDVVELSPGVKRANKWFDHLNNDILSDPHVDLRIEDGRNYVLGTDRKYDMIQAGIIHPGLSSGNASFYTPQFYRECKRILRPGGIVCQWLPIHTIRTEDVKMLIRSFQEVFPHTSVWYKHTSEFCTLIGTSEPLRIDFQDVERRVQEPAIRSHLARSNVVNVYDLLDSFASAGDAVRRAIGGGPLHTDDRPLLEFHCSRGADPIDQVRTIRWLQRSRRPVWPRLTNVPADRRSQVKDKLEKWFRGTQHLIEAQHAAKMLTDVVQPAGARYRENYRRMQEAFERLREVNPEDRNAQFLGRMYLAQHQMSMALVARMNGRMAEALRRLRIAASTAPDTYAGAFAGWALQREMGPPAGSPPPGEWP